MTPRRPMTLVLCLLAIVLLGGCGSTNKEATTPVEFPGERYSAYFEAAKDVLRDAGYTLDRVDARSGVITTMPRPSAGLATPWIAVGSARNLAGDLLHNHARICRIEFAPMSGTRDDLRSTTGALVIQVEVEVLRASTVGRRVDSTMPRRSTFTINPMSSNMSVQESAIMTAGRDEGSEAQIVARIRSRAHAL